MLLDLCTSQKLGVGIHTIHYWRSQGVLEAFQDIPSPRGGIGSQQRFSNFCGKKFVACPSTLNNSD
ncbi:MAG: hypothetical protein N5P05_002370 [Chroococcopsis gigantea SAG 12.99]|nr:hypothetical protein [Chroococcopsis gigantea SAG 12.99]